MNILKINFL